jgi:hypothetical protein
MGGTSGSLAKMRDATSQVMEPPFDTFCQHNTIGSPKYLYLRGAVP